MEKADTSAAAGTDRVPTSTSAAQKGDDAKPKAHVEAASAASSSTASRASEATTSAPTPTVQVPDAVPSSAPPVAIVPPTASSASSSTSKRVPASGPGGVVEGVPPAGIKGAKSSAAPKSATPTATLSRTNAVGMPAAAKGASVAAAAAARAPAGIRAAPSPPAYVKETENMLRLLDQDYPVESPEGFRVREKIIKQLELKLNEWIRRIAPKDGVERKGRVCSIGSYTLGVINQTSDIDLVCIVPQMPVLRNGFVHHLSGAALRDFFIQDFGDILQALPQSADFVRIDTAANPFLSLSFHGVDLDILFCDLAPSAFKYLDNSGPTAGAGAGAGAQLETFDDVLLDLDEPAQRALNGIRVAKVLLKMVANPGAPASASSSSAAPPAAGEKEQRVDPGIQRFRNVLRFVKCWAKRRGIYSNITGYLGGITWAILVAHVCKKYPAYTEAHLLILFFREMANWDWAEKPLLLKPLPHGPSVSDPIRFPLHRISTKHAFHGNTAWQHMAVITPSFPPMNSAHNVTASSKRILLEQIRRSDKICQIIDDMIRNPDDYEDGSFPIEWQEVYAPLKFFEQYQQYVKIDLRFSSVKIRGLLESKLRYLMKNFDLKDSRIVARLYPYAATTTVGTLKTSGASEGGDGAARARAARIATHNKYGTCWWIGFSCTTAASGTAPEAVLDLRETVASWAQLVCPEVQKDKGAVLLLDCLSRAALSRAKETLPDPLCLRPVAVPPKATALVTSSTSSTTTMSTSTSGSTASTTTIGANAAGTVGAAASSAATAATASAGGSAVSAGASAGGEKLPDGKPAGAEPPPQKLKRTSDVETSGAKRAKQE